MSSIIEGYNYDTCLPAGRSSSIMDRKVKSTMYSSDKGVICLTAFHEIDKQGVGSG